MPHVGSREQFQRSVEVYNELLALQKLDEAVFFTTEELAREFSERAQAAKNIKINECNIINVTYDESRGLAEVQVQIEYYSLNSYRLKTLSDVQKWAYVSAGGVKSWRLLSPLPEFR